MRLNRSATYAHDFHTVAAISHISCAINALSYKGNNISHTYSHSHAEAISLDHGHDGASCQNGAGGPVSEGNDRLDLRHWGWNSRKGPCPLSRKVVIF